MFGISLKKEITAIETWSKSSKNKETIAIHLEKISSTLKEVFKELKEDF
jgi:hypothetical protein